MGYLGTGRFPDVVAVAGRGAESRVVKTRSQGWTNRGGNPLVWWLEQVSTLRQVGLRCREGTGPERRLAQGAELPSAGHLRGLFGL